MSNNKVLAIGDIHFPFADKKKINKAIKRIKEEKPNVVIQLGDLNDQYMFSQFASNMNVIMPKKELEKAKKDGDSFWKAIKKAAPKARCIQMIGNHDIRVLKQTLKKFPQVYHILEEAHKELYTFKGVETFYSDRDYVEIDDVVYCHGWSAKHIRHFKKSVVRCHDHQAWVYEIGDQKDAFGGIVIKTTHTSFRNKHILFEISCGMFADETKVPFGYTNSKRTGWKPAIAIVTKETATLEVL